MAHEEGNVNIGSSSMNEDANQNPSKKENVDIAWEFAILTNANSNDKWECLLCKKRGSGGAFRVKEHISGYHSGPKKNVKACLRSTAEDKRRCKEAMIENSKKKKALAQEEQERRREVDINNNRELDELDGVESGGSNKKSRTRSVGPMDAYASQINPESASDNTLPRNTRQQNINDAYDKVKSLRVNQYLARWVYEAGIPFNALDNNSFRLACQAIGEFGPGYIPPTQYQLREPLLNMEVEKTKLSLKTHEDEWEKNGCSIMTDAWSDRKRRSIMNLCVNSKIGTAFISSKEASGDAHTGAYIFDYVNECIESVGEKNVVQVVTDNASNNMFAASLLREKKPHIFWTPCATHTINLMLEAIGKLSTFKTIINKAKSFTIFIYSHHKTLQMMRKSTKREIVRPGVTRFATSFLTLQSLMEKKEALRTMVNSDEWDASKWSKSKKGRAAYSIVVQQTFWEGVSHTLRVFEPLVKVLRLVDGDVKPAMGFVYGELRKAKNEIKAVMRFKEERYKPILDIVDSKGNERINTPLHLTAYLLNPYYYYHDEHSFSPEERDNIHIAVYDCMERFITDIDIMDIVMNIELVKYKNKDGLFGKPGALKGCSQYTFDPVGWWCNYGNGVPHLQKVAKRILSLTTSSSGCERNWSAFEGIHTKKRNRLDTGRMNKLVYVQFNSRLMTKKKRRNDKIDVLLASTALNAQSWMVDGIDDEEVTPGSGLTWEMVAEASGANEETQPRRSSRNNNMEVEGEVREPDEDDFMSDATEDEGDNHDDLDFEFESDKEERDVQVEVGQEVLECF